MTTKAEALEALNALEVDPGSVPNWSAFNALRDFIHSVSEWQPIESAPRDGTEIVLWVRDWCGQGDVVCSGYWDLDCKEPSWQFELGGSAGEAFAWMPSPPHQ